ncbi:hypothetical protein CC77DRAFT_665479 [Alternaria alternata]|uniref:Uncharacterized protein n=1 Tax=Alternaria alternata TaxID=5599 RepID=A0A177D1J1_ALTAL|nr:hypothetical protein CC77DRAFT_665479 [Alternaria alternata]OAG13534.1 hypothetical protein CC77DRAFT_665479 [Alternaria alternata]
MLTRAFQKLIKDPSGESVSMDDIMEALVEDKELQIAKTQDSQNKNSECIQCLYQIAIAATSCLTSFFSWHRSPISGHYAVRGGTSPDTIHQHLENCSRSSGSFISHLGVLPTPYNKIPWPDDLIFLSNLNYHSLVHIGRLCVEWVSDISQHLQLVLSSTTKTLRLYKYPSLCVLALAGGDYQTFSNRIMQDGMKHNKHSIHREVLLSLRFILSQTRKSRKLAQKLAFSTMEIVDRDNAFDLLLEGKLDDLLFSLPSSAPKQLASKYTGNPRKQDTLAPWSDLVLLGQRMLELQRYNAAQRPTQTRKMIKDKRDPVRWYTLWAVLLVGGLGVIIGIMQVALSCAQLATAK